MSAPERPMAFVDAGPVRTAYRSAGDGPLLVMVHGAEADHTMFHALADALADRFTVVAYDQRDSGRTENGDADYGLPALADDLADLVRDRLAAHGARKLHLYGTSFGGQIAQVFAARHPALVDRLVLGSTWRVGRALADFAAPAVAEIAALRQDLPASAPRIAAYFLSPSHLSAHPEAAELFSGTRRTAAQSGRRARMLQTPPPAVDLAAIGAPTLLMAGGADRLIPPGVTFELAEHLADARAECIEGVPHIGAIEAPQELAARIRRFLDSRDRFTDDR